MIKQLLGLGGLVEFLFPRRVIEFGERLAFENPHACTHRIWTVAVARVEGLAYLALFSRAESPPPWVRPLMGLAGGIAVVLPEEYLNVVLQSMYRDADRIEVKPWVVPTTRLLGLGYLLAALTEPDERDVEADGERAQPELRH
jgi:hypothetical protein